MMDSNPPLSEQSWSFALRIYDEPGVAEACLRLQDEFGADVTMLLIAAFAAVKLGIFLSIADVEEMNAVCEPWRRKIVHPLRTMRCALKSWPSGSSETETLRSQIKVSELAAERLQNDMLAGWLQHKATASPNVMSGELREVLRRVVVDIGRGRESAEAADLSLALDRVAEAAGRS